MQLKSDETGEYSFDYVLVLTLEVIFDEPINYILLLTGVNVQFDWRDDLYELGFSCYT